MTLASVRRFAFGFFILGFLFSQTAQAAHVSGRIVSVQKHSLRAAHADVAEVVTWLVPVSEDAVKQTPAPKPAVAELAQKDKAFHPHLLVLPAGSSVQFPNRDPFFHNVFSLFNGKRFDLGLYESGDSRTVHFDRVGISYIFCNIHPEMGAIIVTVNTPHYAVSDASGRFSFKDVAPGKYELHIFAEGLSEETLQKLTRNVQIAGQSTVLPTVEIPERNVALHHQNKYGRDYEPTPGSPYER
jgi:plastocyanin